MKFLLLSSLVLLLSHLTYGERKPENPPAVIEMKLMFDLGWEPVIEIKNCGSNRDMAIDIVEGLALVQLKNGRKPRTYRIIQKGFNPAVIKF